MGLSVRHGILGILAIRPHHGYELKTEFDGLTGGLWELNVGQIYSTLERLLRDGLVSREGADGPGEDRKVYSLTPAGGAELAAWLERPPVKARPLRDEIFVRLGLLMAGDPAGAFRLIEAQRRVCHVQMSALTRKKMALARSGAPDRLHRELLLDAALLHTEADLRWLDICAAKLRSRSGGQRDGR